MIPTTRIKIELSDIGKGKVYVDDADWTDKLSGIDISARAGQRVEVTLHLCLATVDADIPAELSPTAPVYAYG
jgi:hypothetical protein